MNAEILCVGTELLLGDIINTNAAFLAKELAALGIGCYWQSVVGDNPGRLRESLSLALGRADLVITTGGLGPTYDDLTKETVAEYFGLEMELHQPSLDHVTEIFRRIGRPMTPNNEKQAFMPKGATVFHNSQGTANALAVIGHTPEGEKTVIMLPGPPREMTAVFQSGVRPFLQSRSDGVLLSHNIHLFGIGESALEQELRGYMQAHTNPTIAPYAKEGEVLLRVTAKGKDSAEAENLAGPVVQSLCGRFPQFVYGVDVDNLQTALVALLLEKSCTVATAESCTAGLVSKRITEVSGSSQVFGCGVCTYSNEMKEQLLGVRKETLAAYGAVSEQTAAEMAVGIRRLSGADMGLSVTGIAGPGGGTPEKPVGLVYVGIDSPWLTKTLRLSLSRGYSEEREYIRYSAASHALHLALQAAKMA